jgi:prepilin-type N-terminal cleavage/methylation domain-containing protein
MGGVKSSPSAGRPAAAHHPAGVLSRPMKRQAAFTLIELLIVVAIIAILAAIAVPNFLEAQTRSKVSRTKTDMRTTSTALESYFVDNNAYPNCHFHGVAVDPAPYGTGSPGGFQILERLSTPVAYMASVLITDPFQIRGRTSANTAQGQLGQASNPESVLGSDPVYRMNSYIYQSFNSFQRYTLPPDGFSNPTQPRQSRSWILHSAGPDGIYQNLGGVIANDRLPQLPFTVGLIYDPTNGTVSFGSIYRAGGERYGGGYGSGILAAIDKQD